MKKISETEYVSKEERKNSLNLSQMALNVKYFDSCFYNRTNLYGYCLNKNTLFYQIILFN